MKTKWGGRLPQNPRRTVAQGFGGRAFLPSLSPGLSTPGSPRCCSPRLRSTPLPTPPPPLAPGPAAAAAAAAAALPAPEAAQCAQPHCGPAQTAQHLPLRRGGVDQGVRAAGATGREGGARRGGRRGPAGRGSAPLGAGRSRARLVESRKTWGRCWREKENLREEEEKPNLIIFGVEVRFGAGEASSKQVKRNHYTHSPAHVRITSSLSK